MKQTLLIFSVTLFFLACGSKSNKVSENDTLLIPNETPVPSAMHEINKRKELIALTANSSTSYFVYKGRTMGYDYELLRNLAAYLNVKLTIKPVDNLDSIFVKLNRGEGDLIAYTMTVTNERKEKVDFTEQLFVSQQSLVQKKPDNWRKMMLHNIDNSLVRNVLELVNKDVYVRKNSSYYSRLVNLCNEMGDTINIITVDGNISTDQLIDMVAKGEIKYTIADTEIAKYYATYNNIIDYKTPISMPQKMAWAVRKNSPLFRDTINTWLKRYKKYKEYYYIYDKYFENPKRTKSISKSEFTSYSGGKLSKYDEIFKRESKRLNWDWRLLAAQAFQESRFNPKEKSWAGAVGLMQVLPTTAEMHGNHDLNDPAENVHSGVNHLIYIKKKFATLDSLNQLKFSLASYNVGLGHVFDAMRLASAFDKDSTIWDGNVAEMLLLKSKKEYYRLKVCRNGYCKGSEPYNYVKEILERYQDYKHLINE